MVMHVMTEYSTDQVAKALGIDKSTLLRWLYSGKLAEPKVVETPTSKIRIWSEKDVMRAQRHKDANYRKGRGRKARTA
jgi:excisionase family DNA binding protein